MARMTKERLEEKIRIAEEKVARTGRIYNAACEELQELRNKMTAIDNETLVEAFMKSNKTLDEALEFLGSDIKEEPPTARRRGGRRKKTGK